MLDDVEGSKPDLLFPGFEGLEQELNKVVSETAA